MTSAGEKRRFPRVKFHAAIVLHWCSQGGNGSGTVSNMSKVGCYVLTQTPESVGDRVRISLPDVPEMEGEVRYVDEDVGMGIQFLGVTAEIEAKLVQFLSAQAAASA